MKYIKQFENILNPEIGDFVIVRINPGRRKGMDKDIKMFNFITKLESSIGEIVGIPGKVYDVKFDHLPSGIDRSPILNNVRRFALEEILYSSKDKKELEKILASKKYNI